MPKALTIQGNTHVLLFMYSEGFLDYLCGAPADTNPEHANTTAGVTVKTDPSQIILSPPITPPESMNTDDDRISSFSFAEYLSKAAAQQEQSVLSVFQPQVQVKQEAGVFNTSQTVTMTTESQNTTTQYLLNLLQGQKTQQAPPAMNTKTLEQLLQEPSILAPSSQPCTVTVQQPPQVQQPALVTQQVSEFRAVQRKTAFLSKSDWYHFARKWNPFINFKNAQIIEEVRIKKKSHQEIVKKVSENCKTKMSFIL